MKNLELLKKYNDAAAPSGFEKEAFDVMKEHVDGYCDEILQDNIGSFIAVKKSGEDKPNVMLAGHLDEIGFMITKIDDNGFIKFHTLGGWWGQAMLAHKYDVVNSKGERFIGVIGSIPVHALSAEDKTKPADIKNMYIDIGVSSKEEVEKLGLKVGDFIVPHSEFTQLANEKYLLAKAWDNRLGCYVAGEVLKRLHEEKLDVNLFAVGTVQEEVGTRGAITSSHLIKPDIGFALDVGIAGDIPGCSDKDAFQPKLGEGPLITLFDAGLISHVGLRDLVVETAEEFKIKYQYAGLTGGGTDGDAIHISHSGAPTIYLGVAARYVHTDVEMIHADDIEATVELVLQVVKKLNREVISELTYN